MPGSREMRSLVLRVHGQLRDVLHQPRRVGILRVLAWPLPRALGDRDAARVSRSVNVKRHCGGGCMRAALCTEFGAPLVIEDVELRQPGPAYFPLSTGTRRRGSWTAWAPVSGPSRRVITWSSP